MTGTILEAVVDELARAQSDHAPFNSAHEGYAVILEEVDELKKEVFKKAPERSAVKLRKEAVQVGAMAVRFLKDICGMEVGRVLVDTQPRAKEPTIRAMEDIGRSTTFDLNRLARADTDELAAAGLDPDERLGPQLERLAELGADERGEATLKAGATYSPWRADILERVRRLEDGKATAEFDGRLRTVEGDAKLIDRSVVDILARLKSLPRVMGERIAEQGRAVDAQATKVNEVWAGLLQLQTRVGAHRGRLDVIEDRIRAYDESELGDIRLRLHELEKELHPEARIPKIEAVVDEVRKGKLGPGDIGPVEDLPFPPAPDPGPGMDLGRCKTVEIPADRRPERGAPALFTPDILERPFSISLRHEGTVEIAAGPAGAKRATRRISIAGEDLGGEEASALKTVAELIEAGRLRVEDLGAIPGPPEGPENVPVQEGAQPAPIPDFDEDHPDDEREDPPEAVVMLGGINLTRLNRATLAAAALAVENQKRAGRIETYIRGHDQRLIQLEQHLAEELPGRLKAFDERLDDLGAQIASSAGLIHKLQQARDEMDKRLVLETEQRKRIAGWLGEFDRAPGLSVFDRLAVLEKAPPGTVAITQELLKAITDRISPLEAVPEDLDADGPTAPLPVRIAQLEDAVDALRITRDTLAGRLDGEEADRAKALELLEKFERELPALGARIDSINSQLSDLAGKGS